MKNYLLPHRLLSLSALLLSGSIAHHASAEVSWSWQTSLTVGYFQDADDFTSGDADHGSSPTPVVEVGNTVSYSTWGSASVSMSASHGILRGTVLGHANGVLKDHARRGEYFYGAIAGSSGTARFSELLTINHPTLNGTEGTLSYSYYVPGSFSLSSSGAYPGPAQEAAVYVIFRLHDRIGLALATYAVGDHTVLGYSDHPAIPADGIIQGTQGFIFGSPFRLGAELEVRGSAAAYGPSGSEFLADYGHSAYWNGISGVSAGGSPVSGWTISSESGTSYLDSFAPAAVPEPGHCAGLAAAGLLAFGLWRRATRRA